MSKRKQHHPELKAKVALEALKNEQTVSELAVANDFGQKTRILDRQVRRKMIEPNPLGLSVGQQFVLLSISRSSF
jgi:hypothetical protein